MTFTCGCKSVVRLLRIELSPLTACESVNILTLRFAEIFLGVNTSISPTSANNSTSTDTVKVSFGWEMAFPCVRIAGIWIGLNFIKQRRSSSSSGTSSHVPLPQIFEDKCPPDSNPRPKELLHYADISTMLLKEAAGLVMCPGKENRSSPT